MRTHCSHFKVDSINLYPVEQIKNYKPKGFWYEVDNDWQRWTDEEDFHCGEYVFKVELNDCNILLIDTLPKLDEFHSQFYIGDRLSLRGIDWAAVAKKYDGVEIAPYQWERRLALDFMWYYGWDCASGVIWEPKNAKVEYIGIREELKLQGDK
jgi:hypothetical protein